MNVTEVIEVKAALSVDETGHISGIAWPFGSPDRMGDEITPGAFAKANVPLPMLDSHNQGQTVGVWDSAVETPEGLQVKGRLLIDDVARAREVRALVREKAVTGLSIGFQILKATSRKGGGRTITELDLLEVSIVAVPANAGARITSAKGITEMSDTETQDEGTGIAELERKMTERFDSIEAKSDTSKLEERLDKIEAKANRATGAAAETDDPSDARKAFGIYLRKGSGASDTELKALNVTDDSQGGYLAPEEISSEIIRDLVEFSPIRSISSVRGITARSIKYPKREGITNAQWEGEMDEAQESTVPFGQVEVTPHKLMTYVDISNELLADSGGTAESETRLALAEDFGQKEGAAFVGGSGVGQPEGILTNPDILTVDAAAATTIDPDELIGMMYELPAMYRNRSTWALNGTTLGVLRTLKDGDGRFLWQPSFQAGQPETILGRPVVEVPDMPDIATGATPIVLGDFEGYRIVDRLAMSVLVNPYLLATRGITRIHATRRVGGRVIQAARFRKYAMA